MNLNLTDKRVLVTGSSRGIGLAIAREFSLEGARVILCARNKSELAQSRAQSFGDVPDDRILTFAVDVTDGRELTKMLRGIHEAWGGLDVLVNNIGSGESVPDPIPMKDRFSRTVETNFISAVDVSRAFLPELEAAGGSILFIGSITGHEALGAPVDYSTAKSALISFSKNLARKVGSRGVRVNCICPGNIYFKGGTWDRKVRENKFAVEDMLRKEVPLGRLGNPEEIARAAVFLSSDASSFTTGACLIIDGGQTRH